MAEKISNLIWDGTDNKDAYKTMSDDEYLAVCAEKAANAEADGKVEAVEMAQHLLTDSDWTQLGDTGLTKDCQSNFRMYRAKLRTIRRNPTVDPTWPTKPKEEWE